MAVPAQTAAVVIPCRNEARSIAHLLDSLAAQSRLPDSVIVVDDASSDGTSDVVQAWAREHQALPVSAVAANGRGAGAAMNAGIAQAQADIIVRLDGHCGPRPEYIERSLETLAVDGAGIAGGVWMIEPGARTPTARAIAAVLSHSLGSGGAEYRRPPQAGDRDIRDVDTVPFGAFRKSVWKEVGGFDETLIRNQDYDFNYRVRLTGRRVILNPAIVSTYHARPTLSALWRQYFDYGFWKMVMLRKFPRSIRLRQLLPLLLAPSVLVLIACAALGSSLIPLLLLAAYLLMNFGGALQASARVGDVGLTPFAFVALLVLQNAWSAGAWASLLKGARASRA